MDNLKIENPISEIIKNINLYSEEHISNSIQKIAKELAISNEDLADYLSLVVKIATNNEIKNAKISFDYLKSKLSKEAADNFEEEYNKEKERAKTFGIKNANKVALFSAMVKTGVKIE